MSRRVRVLSVAAGALILSITLTLTASGGVHGTPGGAGLHDPYFPKAGNGGYDVRHYGLTLAYDPGTRHLTGTAVITARATQNLTAFDLDLKGLDVDTVTVGGKKARWNRAGQELTIRPHGDLKKGATFATTVRYSGSPETITDPDGSKEGWLRTADGALALGEPVGSMAWFPDNDLPSDKASYDITITVPKGLQAVSNGELKSETTDGDRTAFVWHCAEPMASYLATVAIGHFTITRTTTSDGLPVYVAVDPTQAAASKIVLARIPEIIAWEQQTFGPYPLSSTGAIVDRPGDAGYALETQNRPVFPGAPELHTLVHELSHQWYGDSVTPKNWRDMWLNEGFATYAGWLWQEDHGGQTAQQIFDRVYATPKDDATLWGFPPGKPPGAAHISERPVYEWGAMVLHKIRQTVGDDRFYAILRGWAATHRHGNADTAEFTAYVEKMAPGRNFDAIWKDWLYGDGKPAHP
ncbi:M1 family metallopeptidase [Streptomyces sp. Ag109_O5-10]|uniref:M1 family metallopeptidase n=1 Tax=Streptomyces sp. Ag109_O5-10 TaxID=1855349 RepID=UPI00089D05DE|nr:M1 family metallopeptidase [Streptomyces sp. Ag109_O5-10]SEE95924.1 Peptidase family M1 [Streptomyces sp. Ag109_O5-10]